MTHISDCSNFSIVIYISRIIIIIIIIKTITIYIFYYTLNCNVTHNKVYTHIVIILISLPSIIYHKIYLRIILLFFYWFSTSSLSIRLIRFGGKCHRQWYTYIQWKVRSPLMIGCNLTHLPNNSEFLSISKCHYSYKLAMFWMKLDNLMWAFYVFPSTALFVLVTCCLICTVQTSSPVLNLMCKRVLYQFLLISYILS